MKNIIENSVYIGEIKTESGEAKTYFSNFKQEHKECFCKAYASAILKASLKEKVRKISEVS